LKALPNVHDPFPVYAWLRDNDPVHWSSTLNGWLVTRFADVIEIFNRPGRFASDRFRKIDERYAADRVSLPDFSARCVDLF
jgi:cytochrome P450